MKKSEVAKILQIVLSKVKVIFFLEAAVGLKVEDDDYEFKLH